VVRSSGGAVFYLHPWEIDPDQLKLQAGRLGISSYRNLGETESGCDASDGLLLDAIDHVVAQVRDGV
jgi:hypothetical protein